MALRLHVLDERLLEPTSGRDPCRWLASPTRTPRPARLKFVLALRTTVASPSTSWRRWPERAASCAKDGVSGRCPCAAHPTSSSARAAASRSTPINSSSCRRAPPSASGGRAQANDDDLLRALALYLSSSFVQYHQFFISPQQGIRSGRATLRDLEALPIPFLDPKRGPLRPWAKLQRRLATLSARRWATLDQPSSARRDRALEQVEAKLVELEGEVDDLTARALGLRPQERWLIDDLVHVRLHLLDGKVGELAVAPPTPTQIVEYARALRDTLDFFLDRGDGYRHIVTVVQGPWGGVVQIAFERRTTPHEVRVLDAEDAVSEAIAVMRQRVESADNQWLYFDRNLTLYFDEKVFICKPQQRLWWTRSRALADADRVIADLVSSGIDP